MAEQRKVWALMYERDWGPYECSDIRLVGVYPTILSANRAMRADHRKYEITGDVPTGLIYNDYGGGEHVSGYYSAYPYQLKFSVAKPRGGM